jgi:hypothetical protein
LYFFFFFFFIIIIFPSIGFVSLIGFNLRFTVENESALLFKSQSLSSWPKMITSCLHRRRRTFKLLNQNTIIIQFWQLLEIPGTNCFFSRLENFSKYILIVDAFACYHGNYRRCILRTKKPLFHLKIIVTFNLCSVHSFAKQFSNLYFFNFQVRPQRKKSFDFFSFHFNFSVSALVNQIKINFLKTSALGYLDWGR